MGNNTHKNNPRMTTVCQPCASDLLPNEVRSDLANNWRGYLQASEAASLNGSISDDPCTICLDDTSDAATMTLECKHIFHINCIHSWCLRAAVASCPLCKAETQLLKSAGEFLRIAAGANTSTNKSPYRVLQDVVYCATPLPEAQLTPIPVTTVTKGSTVQGRLVKNADFLRVSVDVVGRGALFCFIPIFKDGKEVLQHIQTDINCSKQLKEKDVKEKIVPSTCRCVIC